MDITDTALAAGTAGLILFCVIFGIVGVLCARKYALQRQNTYQSVNRQRLSTEEELIA